MAMSRLDGLPLHGENVDYNLNDTPTFAGDTERLHVVFTSFQHADRDIALDPLSTNPLQANLVNRHFAIFR